MPDDPTILYASHSQLPDSGAADHFEIDRLLPTEAEKEGLRQLDPTIPDFSSNSLLIKRAITDTANPPTDAELDTAFGTPTAVGAGFVAILDDNDADANVYVAISNGTSWWYAALTKAV